jgi:hypothetical protein
MYLSIFLCVCLYDCVCVYMLLHPSQPLPVCLSDCPSVSLFNKRLCVPNCPYNTCTSDSYPYVSVLLPVCLSVCQSVCFSIHLLNHCLSVYLTVHLSFYLMTLDVYQSVPTKPVQLFPILRCLSICLTDDPYIPSVCLSICSPKFTQKSIWLPSVAMVLLADMRLSWKNALAYFGLRLMRLKRLKWSSTFANKKTFYCPFHNLDLRCQGLIP